MHITIATNDDYSYICEHDRHLVKELIQRKIDHQEIYMIRSEADAAIGWMRYGYFWDNIPFMNMLWLDEPYRGKGYGKQVVDFWEDMMKKRGYKLVMTSTMSNEQAQHFYRKLGYKDSGALLLEHEPLEIMLTKALLT